MLQRRAGGMRRGDEVEVMQSGGARAARGKSALMLTLRRCGADADAVEHWASKHE